MTKGKYIRTAEIRSKNSLSMIGRMQGEDHPKWKGNKVSYQALHNWVRRRLGAPRECSNCGFESDNPRQFHWANISGTYSRDLTDWVRLCVTCHWALDRESRLEKRKLRYINGTH